MSMRKRTLPSGWYPGSADECNREIDEFLRGFAPPEGAWMGGVAPHAGWYFSGRAAAKIVRSLSASTRPDRVVVYGGHLGGRNDPIVYSEDSWDTPLGPQQLDSAFAAELMATGHAIAASRGFADNTVEIQLPFIRRFFPDVPLIAIHAPSSERAIRLGTFVADHLAGQGRSAVFLGSSDLTHYGPNYGFVPKGVGASAVQWVKEENDRALIEKALAGDAEGLLRSAAENRNTCSAGPIAAVMASVTRHGIRNGTLVEYYTSYDVMPDSSFVGYAAMLF